MCRSVKSRASAAEAMAHKVTLEQAILQKMNSENVRRDNNVLVIDSTLSKDKFLYDKATNSNKRFREDDSENGSSGAINMYNVDQQNLEDQLNFWKSKYHTLRLCHDEEFKDMLKENKLYAHKQDKLVEYIKIVEKKYNVKEDETISKIITSSTVDTAPIIMDKSLSSNILKFYEKFTGMKIVFNTSLDTDASTSSYTCTVKNDCRNISTKFQLDIKTPLHALSKDDKPENVTFTPYTNALLLPDYLRDEVAFNEEALPVVLGDILQALYDE